MGAGVKAGTIIEHIKCTVLVKKLVNLVWILCAWGTYIRGTVGWGNCPIPEILTCRTAVGDLAERMTLWTR